MLLITNVIARIESQQRYLPFGQVRTDEFAPNPGITETEFAYTGQRANSSIKLLDYKARWYDPELGRFISPDSIAPISTQGVQAWNRYAYANNSPIINADPS